MIPTEWILYLTSSIVAIALYSIFTRRSMIRILIAAELILNAAIINFVAFSVTIDSQSLTGEVFVVLIVGTAAAELAIGIVLIMQLYKKLGSIDVSLANKMRVDDYKDLLKNSEGQVENQIEIQDEN